MKDYEKLKEIISEKQGEWGNGHDIYMIVNVDVEKLLHLLDDIGIISYLSDAQFSSSGKSIIFEGNGDRYTPLEGYGSYCDLLILISRHFPDAICCHADCWDYPEDFTCVKNSSVYRGYNAVLEIWEDDNNEWRTEMAITIPEDDELSLELGSGLLLLRPSQLDIQLT